MTTLVTVLATVLLPVPGASAGGATAGGAAPATPATGDAAAPALGDGFTPLVPARIQDSRRPDLGLTGSWGPTTTRDLVVHGRGGVPATATAVVLNVTVTGGSATSDLRLWPAGSPTPTVSNLNWIAGETRANLVVVAVGDGGAVHIRNQSGTVHVVADVVGYHAPGGDGFVPVTPVRTLDTRGCGFVLTPTCPLLEPGRVREVDVLDDPAPPRATAAVLSVTATGGTADSDLRVWPTDLPVPPVSSLNWAAGETRANVVIVPLSGELVAMRNQAGTVDVVVDLVGWYVPVGSGDGLHRVPPTRIQDSRRTDRGLPGPWSAGEVRELPVAGVGGVPADATSVVVNVTVTGGTAASDLRLWPAGEAVPRVSNLNWAPGQTVPGFAVVKLGDDGAVAIRNQSGDVHVIVDVVGYHTERTYDLLSGVVALDGNRPAWGEGTTCAVLADGGAACWGANADGQLGIGSSDPKPTPVAVAGLDDVTGISVGTGHACAVLADTTVSCWGRNAEGQLGDGTTTDRLTPTPVVGLTGAVAVSAGSTQSCAVRSDGGVWCWGVPEGSGGSPAAAAPFGGLIAVAEVDLGDGHGCARMADSTARCWGRNEWGQIGNGTTDDSAVPVAVVADHGTTDALAGIETLAVGSSTSCAVVDRAPHTLCWGYSAELEHSTPYAVTVPSWPPGAGDAVDLAVSGVPADLCVVRDTGLAGCFAVVHPNDGYASTLVGSGATEVAIGAGTCALLDDGTVRCTGFLDACRAFDEGPEWVGCFDPATPATVQLLPPDASPPAPPRQLSREVRSGTGWLQWRPPFDSDVVAYEVYRSDDPSSLGTLVTPAPIPGTTHVDAALTDGTVDHWRVVAVDASGNRSASSPPLAA